MKTQINKLLNRFGYQLTRRNGIPLNAGMLDKFRFFSSLFGFIRNIDGDVVECGIGFGHSLFLLSYLSLVEDKGRIVRGFDSFEGFPEPSKEDQSKRNPQKGEWKVITPEELIDVFVRRSGLLAYNRLVITPGFFEQTLPKADVVEIAFLHLDVDLYQSYKTCLENLYSKVVHGGVIVFDEYRQQQDVWPGAVKAIDEFFSDKNERIEYSEAFDRYFLFKRASSPVVRTASS